MSNALVSLTVTRFRPMKSLASPDYVEASTGLAAHEDVTLVDRAGVPTLRVKRPVNIEIGLGSADPAESYRPLAVYFQQKTSAATVKSDPLGEANFTQSLTRGSLVMRHNCVLRGPNGHYEFFVLIQRVSDGAIGLIDPEVETEEAEA